MPLTFCHIIFSSVSMNLLLEIFGKLSFYPALPPCFPLLLFTNSLSAPSSSSIRTRASRNMPHNSFSFSRRQHFFNGSRVNLFVTNRSISLNGVKIAIFKYFLVGFSLFGFNNTTTTMKELDVSHGIFDAYLRYIQFLEHIFYSDAALYSQFLLNFFGETPFDEVLHCVHILRLNCSLQACCYSFYNNNNRAENIANKLQNSMSTAEKQITQEAL